MIVTFCSEDSARQWGLLGVHRCPKSKYIMLSLHWRHNDHDSVWNHQPHGCFLNRLFRRRSKKTSKLRVTGLCVGNSPVPQKGPISRKMYPLDDVIMVLRMLQTLIWKPGIIMKVKCVHTLTYSYSAIGIVNPSAATYFRVSSSV